jgi:nicotinamidase-related amidase
MDEGISLDEYLKSQQFQRLVITGLATQGCVLANCLGAFASGYLAVLVQDGHSNYHRQAASISTEWNQKLADEHIVVLPAEAISFESAS